MAHLGMQSRGKLKTLDRLVSSSLQSFVEQEKSSLKAWSMFQRRRAVLTVEQQIVTHVGQLKPLWKYFEASGVRDTSLKSAILQMQ